MNVIQIDNHLFFCSPCMSFVSLWLINTFCSKNILFIIIIENTNPLTQHSRVQSNESMKNLTKWFMEKERLKFSILFFLFVCVCIFIIVCVNRKISCRWKKFEIMNCTRWNKCKRISYLFFSAWFLSYWSKRKSYTKSGT